MSSFASCPRTQSTYALNLFRYNFVEDSGEHRRWAIGLSPLNSCMSQMVWTMWRHARSRKHIMFACCLRDFWDTAGQEQFDRLHASHPVAPAALSGSCTPQVLLPSECRSRGSLMGVERTVYACRLLMSLARLPTRTLRSGMLRPPLPRMKYTCSRQLRHHCPDIPVICVANKIDGAEFVTLPCVWPVQPEMAKKKFNFAD